MSVSTWKPKYTTRALEFWNAYQREHDLSTQRGRTAAIDQRTGQVWIGGSGAEIADQMAG